MKYRRASAVLVALFLISCTTTQPSFDRFATIQTAVIATQSAAQAFGLVYQANKLQAREEWEKRYALAALSYQGSQLLLLAACSNAEAEDTTSLRKQPWDQLRQQIQVPFENLAGPS